MSNEIMLYESVKSGNLEIDEQGRIWRNFKKVPRRRAELKNNCGYLIVTKQIEGKLISTMAARLVWFHFHGPIPGGLEINHKNRNKADNRPENLELLTHSENIQHSYDTGRIILRGEKTGRSKLTADKVREIRRLRNEAGMFTTDLGKMFGVSQVAISHILSGKTWSHVQ